MKNKFKTQDYLDRTYFIVKIYRLPNKINVLTCVITVDMVPDHVFLYLAPAWLVQHSISDGVVAIARNDAEHLVVGIRLSLLRYLVHSIEQRKLVGITSRLLLLVL